MDLLANFTNTLAVMQAEQIFTRRRIPFETVPRSRFDRARCGLAILFSADYLDQARSALAEIGVKADLEPVDQGTPKKF